LKARAVALLAQREHSALELRRKLLRIARAAEAAAVADATATAAAAAAAAGTAADSGDVDSSDAADEAIQAAVDDVLQWLLSNGYLDESRFVASRLHVRGQRFGQRRIEQELSQHGLTLDAEQRAGLSASQVGVASDLLRRKFGETLPSEPRDVARQLRFLLSRGFSAETARRALRDVGSKADVEDDESGADSFA
jgi:regulatory protein